MLSIQISATASQVVQTQVNNQSVVINIYQKAQGLFADVIANGTSIVAGVLCLDAVPLIGSDYLTFSGNFIFIDTQGNKDPHYSGLGSRFQLLYLTEEEYALV